MHHEVNLKSHSLLLNLIVWFAGIIIALLNHQILNPRMIGIQWLILIILLGVLSTFYVKSRYSTLKSDKSKCLLVSINIISALFFVWVSMSHGVFFFFSGFVLLLLIFYFVTYFYHLSLREIFIYGLKTQAVLLLYLPVYVLFSLRPINSIVKVYYVLINLSFAFVVAFFLLERKRHFGELKKISHDDSLSSRPITGNKPEIDPTFYQRLFPVFSKMTSPSILENYPEIIYQLLELTGESCAADRAYIFQISKDTKYIVNTYEWCGRGIKSQIKNLQKVPVADYPWWIGKLKRGEIICIHSLNELPPEAVHEKEILAIQDITGVIVVGMYRDHKLIGFFGLDYAEKSENPLSELIPVVKIVAGMLSCLYNRLQIMYAPFSEDENGLMLPENDTFNQELLARNFFSAVMQTPVLVVDDSLSIITMNSRTRKDFYIGQDLNPAEDKKDYLFISEKDRSDFMTSLRRALVSDDILSVLSENPCKVKDAYYSVYYFKIFDDHNNTKAMILYFIEMTALYMNRLNLMKSLEEKNLLISEIHHRVKNNMQIMANLMDLKAMIINEKNALIVFYDTRDRLKGLALLHEKLYESQDFGKTQLHKYLRELGENLIFVFSGDKNISFQMIRAEPVEVTFDKAITLGMLLNEIIVNSIKHAFNQTKEGLITCSLFLWKDTLVLEIGDNGCGFDEMSPSSDAKTLGLNLISGFVSELKGTCERRTDHGTVYTIHIPC